jgi:hypothetical protein
MNILVASLCPRVTCNSVTSFQHLFTPKVEELGCSVLDAGVFVPVPRDASAPCDHPRRLPLPKTQLNSRGRFFMAKRAHPLYSVLLFRLDHPQFQPLVFFLLSRMHRFLQDRRGDAQICHVLVIERVVWLIVIDL